MIRALSKYRAAARTEISVLETLRGEHGCVRMLRHFEHHSHVCLALPPRPPPPPSPYRSPYGSPLRYAGLPRI